MSTFCIRKTPQYVAVATDRQVTGAHSRMGHKCIMWKDWLIGYTGHMAVFVRFQLFLARNMRDDVIPEEPEQWLVLYHDFLHAYDYEDDFELDLFFVNSNYAFHIDASGAIEILGTAGQISGGSGGVYAQSVMTYIDLTNSDKLNPVELMRDAVTVACHHDHMSGHGIEVHICTTSPGNGQWTWRSHQFTPTFNTPAESFWALEHETLQWATENLYKDVFDEDDSSGRS